MGAVRRELVGGARARTRRRSRSAVSAQASTPTRLDAGEVERARPSRWSGENDVQRRRARRPARTPSPSSSGAVGRRGEGAREQQRVGAPHGADDDEAEGRVEGGWLRRRGPRGEPVGQDEHDLAPGRACTRRAAGPRRAARRSARSSAAARTTALRWVSPISRNTSWRRTGPDPSRGSRRRDQGVELVDALGRRQAVGADDDASLPRRQRGDGCRERALGRHRGDRCRDDGERRGEAERRGDGEPAQPGAARAGGEQRGEHAHGHHLLRATDSGLTPAAVRPLSSNR